MRANNIPNHLKLPHIGYRWKFLKHLDVSASNASLNENEKRTINLSQSNICPNRTCVDESPLNKKQKKSNLTLSNYKIDQIDSVEEVSESGKIKRIADDILQQYKKNEVNKKPDNLLKKSFSNNHSQHQQPLQKCQSMHQIKLNDSNDVDVNQFTHFFQLIQKQQKEKVHKRKCQNNFFKKSSSMDSVDFVKQQMRLTQLILRQKMRIRPKFSPTINIQDLLQQN